MRRLWLIAVLLLVVGVWVAPASAQEPNLAELLAARAAADAPEYTALLAALEAADPMVLDALSDPDLQLTVFAPSDAAFASLQAQIGDEAFNALLADPVALTRLLLYHVAPGVLDYATLEAGINAVAALPYAGALRVTLPTLQGQHLDVLPSFESLMIDQASLTADRAGEQASNGLIHPIDSVLQPSDTTIGEVVATVAGGSNPQFTLLQQALTATGLDETLSDPAADRVTLFAPTDEAFSAALAALDLTAEQALADTDLLARILTYHVVPGAVHADRIGAAATLDPAPAWLAGVSEDGSVQIHTLNGAPLSFQSGADGQPQINGANIVVNDFDAVNGVIFVIDALLLPPSE